MLGKTVSHYRITEKLGEGGMGVVYRAEDTILKRTVALKFLPRELTRDAGAKERFIREAQAASALDHPNICTVFEVNEADDQTFIAMACVEGGSVKDRLAAGPMDIDVATDVAAQVAEGLEEAHDKGIVHRDIKAANIMLTPKGQAKIMDFGLAKLSGGSGLTRTGVTMGTVAYMSPEQVRGEEVDRRTDVWSLGVLLYEMVTGHMPFEAEYEPAAMYSILNENPRPMAAFRPDVPVELEHIVETALAKSLEERYQTASEMKGDLRALRAGRTVGVAEQFIARARFAKKSIAVLPFKSLSDSKEDEYFSDGTTEDIISQLSKIGELKVISRTSAMRFKNTTKSLREIGRELDVATILEGSVRRSGDRVRIVSQLVDTRTDEPLWTETYDRQMSDIFEIQSDVAQKIATELRAQLSPEVKRRMERKPTESLEAYDYYLKGREYYYRYRKQDNEHAIELFKKALELDPDYALAYAGLGDALQEGEHAAFIPRPPPTPDYALLGERHRHGGALLQGPLVHGAVVELDVLVAQNLGQHEPGARGLVAGVAVGDGRGLGVQAAELEDVAVGVGCQQASRVAALGGHQAGVDILRTRHVTGGAGAAGLGQAQVVGVVTRVDQLGRPVGLGLGHVVGGGVVLGAAVGLGDPVPFGGLDGGGAHLAAGGDPAGGAAVEHGDVVFAVDLELPEQAGGVIEVQRFHAGRDDDDGLASRHAPAAHQLLEVGTLGDHGLDGQAVDDTVHTHLLVVHGHGAVDVATKLDQEFLAGLLVGLELGRDGEGLLVGAHVQDGDVGAVPGQPLAIDHGAGHVQRQGPLGQAQQGSTGNKADLGFQGCTPQLVKG